MCALVTADAKMPWSAKLQVSILLGILVTVSLLVNVYLSIFEKRTEGIKVQLHANDKLKNIARPAKNVISIALKQEITSFIVPHFMWPYSLKC